LLKVVLNTITLTQGIPQQPGTRQIAYLMAFYHGYFVFRNENVKVKVKYGFVLHTSTPCYEWDLNSQL
jgi:hypothetical protein